MSEEISLVIKKKLPARILCKGERNAEKRNLMHFDPSPPQNQEVNPSRSSHPSDSFKKQI